jgi:hypothetical protein
MRSAWVLVFALPRAAQLWPVYGGDDDGSNYSIKSNVARLKPMEFARRTDATVSTPVPLERTPVMIDGVFYLPSRRNGVGALVVFRTLLQAFFPPVFAAGRGQLSGPTLRRGSTGPAQSHRFRKLAFRPKRFG